MGWIVRITIGDIDQADELELELATAKLNDRRPDWLQNLRELSRVETRRHLRDHGLSLETFRGVELSAVIPPTDLLDVPQRYGEKLAKALYYMHSGRVVPANGVVKVRALTNSEFMSTKFPREGFSFLTAQPLLTRAGKRLDDQFAYRYAVATDGPAAGFLIQFRESMAIIALVYEEAAAYEDRMAARRHSGAAPPV